MALSTARLATAGLPSARASVNYLAPTAEMPIIDVAHMERSNCRFEARMVDVADARPIRAELSLETNGFVLVDNPLPALDLDDAEALRHRYIPIARNLIQQATGADKVLVAPRCELRFSKRSKGLEAGEGFVNLPATFAHTDYTRAGILDIIAHSVDTDGDGAEGALVRHELETLAREQRRYRRVLAVQTWRVLSPPPHDTVLTICAADSVARQDIVEGATVNPYDPSQTYPLSLYTHNADHLWYYFSGMNRDEALVFVGYDFDEPANCRVLHTAFEEPADGGHQPRISVETRGFALFE